MIPICSVLEEQIAARNYRTELHEDQRCPRKLNLTRFVPQTLHRSGYSSCPPIAGLRSVHLWRDILTPPRLVLERTSKEEALVSLSEKSGCGDAGNWCNLLVLLRNQVWADQRDEWYTQPNGSVRSIRESSGKIYDKTHDHGENDASSLNRGKRSLHQDNRFPLLLQSAHADLASTCNYKGAQDLAGLLVDKFENKNCGHSRCFRMLNTSDSEYEKTFLSFTEVLFTMEIVVLGRHN